MRRGASKWVIALVLSGALHAGAAAVLSPGAEEIRIEGGQTTEIALLGDMIADQRSAGDVADTIEPVENAIVEPVEPAAAQSPEVETAETPPRTEPVDDARAVTADPAPTARAEISDPAQAETVEPVTDVTIAALPPVDQEEDEVETQQAEAIEIEELQPVEETEEVAALVHVPLPTPRPDYTPAVMPRAEKPRAEAPKQAEKKPVEKPAQKQAQKQSGSDGQNEADARKGIADGSTRGSAAAQGDSGRTTRAGNADLSNYPGKVASKLRRSLRYPSEARRNRLRGEVHISFSIDRSGGVGSVRIARSSGSPVLDNAAIDTVRRAAPFPPIPDGAGRSNWPFTVPLAFTR